MEIKTYKKIFYISIIILIICVTFLMCWLYETKKLINCDVINDNEYEISAIKYNVHKREK
jgi:cell division protein FtsL